MTPSSPGIANKLLETADLQARLKKIDAEHEALVRKLMAPSTP